jgi:hypothetical protein
VKHIIHPGLVHSKEWAPLLRGGDLKQGLRAVIRYIEQSDFANRCEPLANNPKIAVRGPVGEIIALSWFNLTRNDPRVGFDFMHWTQAYEDRKIKGIKKDDLGCDAMGYNINNKISTQQTKLIENFNHSYTTGQYGLEERKALDSFRIESDNIFSANDVVVKEGQKDYQIVLWMTCQAIPHFTSEEKLRGKLLQCCFSKTNYKKGIININDFTHPRFMSDMTDLIISSAEAL